LIQGGALVRQLGTALDQFLLMKWYVGFRPGQLAAHRDEQLSDVVLRLAGAHFGPERLQALSEHPAQVLQHRLEIKVGA
jgi:hypothetical protein